MGKKILVVGHAFIVEANRKVWNKLADDYSNDIDLVIPKAWKSNLVGDIESNFKNTKNFKIHPLKTYFTGNGSKFFFEFLGLFKILSKTKYDSIIINQEGWSLSLLFFNLLNRLTKNKKTPIFLMIAQNLKKENLRWAIPIEKFNLRFVYKTLGCCNETEDVLRWKGIDTPWSYFPLYYGEGFERLEQKNIGEKIKIGYLGRLSEEKGIHCLIEAFRLIRNKYNVELVIAGSGPLESLIADEEGVRYLGVIPHELANKFYDEIDIFILPSLTKGFWKEQFGRVIVESVASKTMIFGSSSGAIPEVLGHLGIDYVFDENQPMQIFSLFERYIQKNNQIDLDELFLKNKKLFSMEAFNERLEGLIEGAASNG